MLFLDKVKSQWQYVLNHLDENSAEAVAALESLGRVIDESVKSQDKYPALLGLVQNHLLRISWKRSCCAVVQHFAGDSFEAVREQIKKIHDKVLRGRVFIALHMHAGDGNVHTNIPVNSDDIDMLRIANEAVVYVMGVAKKLGGAISGEHGIGMTKS